MPLRRIEAKKEKKKKRNIYYGKHRKKRLWLNGKHILNIGCVYVFGGGVVGNGWKCCTERSFVIESRNFL